MAKYTIVKGGNLVLQAVPSSGYQFVEWQWKGATIVKGTEIEGVTQVDVQDAILHLNGVNSQVGTAEEGIQAVFDAVVPPENVDIYVEPGTGGSIEQLSNE